MAKYAFRDADCTVCHQHKRSCVRLDIDEPVVCLDCTPAKPIDGNINFRLGWKPSVSKISGFGKSFDDFDRDYDRIMNEGA